MKNGRADHNDDPEKDPKIARIEDARRRRQLGLGEPETGKRSKARRRTAFAAASARDVITGGIIIAMALGMIVWWTEPLWRTAVAGLGR
jgi:hypothetical protein